MTKGVVRKNREPALDLCRAAAISMVLLYHWPRSDTDLIMKALGHFGWAGVDLFFALSGLLIGSQYFEARRRGDFNSSVFYIKRIMRTFPAYFTMLLVLWVSYVRSGIPSPLNWSFFIFLQNYWLLEEFTSSWSLCVEEQFYFIFPIIAGLLFRKRTQTKSFLAFAIAIFSAGLIYRGLQWREGRPDLIALSSIDQAYDFYLRKIYYATPARVDGLLIGVCLAYARSHRQTFWAKLIRHPPLTGCLALGAAAAGLALNLGTMRFNLWCSMLSFPLLALAAASAILCSLGSPVARAMGTFKAVNWLSSRSYSLYLVHTLLPGMVSVQLGLKSHDALLFVTTSLIGAEGLYRIAELPGLKARDVILRKFMKNL